MKSKKNEENSKEQKIKLHKQIRYEPLILFRIIKIDQNFKNYE